MRIAARSRAIFLIIAMTLLCFMLPACGSEPEDSAGSVDVAEEQQITQEETEPETEPETGQETATEVLLYDSSDFLADIPEWSGFAFYYVNGNKPDFEPDEIWTSTQESLDPLDDLGRCGAANSCIGQDGMPTEGRGNISEIHPTGWHTERYDFVEGEALFNRCHLIAHQLSGDDAIPRNLITGTSYMNRDGMLQFENSIGNYVRNTGNHVMYRVTPIFAGEELVARGVHMEAVSVEDQGEGLAFNVFCYNVQPGIDIDYMTGDNRLSDDTEMLEEYQAGRFAMIANTHGETADSSLIADGAQPGEDAAKNGVSDGSTAEGGSTDGSAAEGGASGEAQDEKSPVRTYVLNTNTGKFHYPDCRSVKDMKEKNKQVTEATREEIIARGFSPCGNCHP